VGDNVIVGMGGRAVPVGAGRAVPVGTGPAAGVQAAIRRAAIDTTRMLLQVISKTPVLTVIASGALAPQSNLTKNFHKNGDERLLRRDPGKAPGQANTLLAMTEKYF